MRTYYTNLNQQNELFALLENRAKTSSADITVIIRNIIDDIKTRGDAALSEYCEKFDKYCPPSLVMSQDEIDAAAKKIDPSLEAIIREAADNIRIYHEKQLSEGYEMYSKGKKLGRIVRPLKKVGVYVPGGTAAYPSTVLMN